MKRNQIKERELSAVKLIHINRQIPPIAHTPMYNFHKYWSRKTWNVVGEFVKNYCPEHKIVFDPFGGSGVTAMEALKYGRKVIISDLNPIATEIIRLTIKNVNLSQLHNSYKKVEKEVKVKIQNLYITKCRKCGAEFPFDCAIWKKDKCQFIRYYGCPSCGDSQVGNNEVTEFDINALDRIDKQKIEQWYPTNKLFYTNGKPFKEKQKFLSLDQLFTKRNLYGLAVLMTAIEKEPKKELRDFLKIGFSSMIHLCSKMTPVRPSRHMSSAWTQHSYWYANEFMESNVWEKFESAIIGKQGLIKAKEESNGYYSKIKFGKTFQDVIDGDSDVFIFTGDCLELMNKMNKYYGNNGCVDYIFTDPPYDSSIQYGELSYLWVAWLKKDKGYVENIVNKEIIHNEKQKKDFTVYTSLLKNSFNGMFGMLKSDKYLTLTFHNPTFKVRNSTIRTGVLSGFELNKIHHQELAHSSPKSLLQPFGSAQGDFYLRFYKPFIDGSINTKEFMDEKIFEKIITETTIKILAERGEPTPYTIIINAIDPELAKQGFFSELNTGMNVENVLKKHLDKEFRLIETHIGSTKGKLWWFTNISIVPHLATVPLSDRVEETVLKQLQSKGRVTFTDIWEAVSNEFPNSLTSDQSSIKNSLEDYARPITGGYWMLKENFKSHHIENEHTTIMAILAEIGIEMGYKIYIGKVEQSHHLDSNLIEKKCKLEEYLSYRNLKSLKNANNIETVGDIDLLWIDGNYIKYVFEVESTTSMTSALYRGSNIDKDVPKVMLIPADRLNQFERKKKSPMFSERLINDNWRFILFEKIIEAWTKHKSKTNIDELFNVGSHIPHVIIKDRNQLEIDFQ